jgi:hypothetical protein
VHSELVVAEHVIRHHAVLGTVDAWGSKKMPYQYIGGSLLNCAKCNALIRGEKGIVGFNMRPTSKSLPLFIFSRGHYHTGYPQYGIPKISLEINGMSSSRLQQSLNEISSASSKLPLEDLVRIQEAELSDSDIE